MEDHVITVVLEGGVVQCVHGIPPGGRLVIRELIIDPDEMKLYAAEGRLFKVGDAVFSTSVWTHLPRFDLKPLTPEPVQVMVEEVEELFK